MNTAYVDTSVLASIILNEPGRERLAGLLNDYDTLLASNLLEAEIRAVCARERVDFEPRVVSRVRWVLPDRVLAPEFAKVLRTGYLRGADLWHVASALYASPQPGATRLRDPGQPTGNSGYHPRLPAVARAINGRRNGQRPDLG